MLKTATQIRYQVRGETFGARDCSCSCDPCDCDPCECENASYPAWRMSGYFVEEGVIEGVDVGQTLLLSLARPAQPENHYSWQEVILVSDTLSTAQTQALLALFEDQLESLPAEAQGLAVPTVRPVYAASIQYLEEGDELTLNVTLQPDAATLLRAGNQQPVAPWHYTGSIAIRSHFQENH